MAYLLNYTREPINNVIYDEKLAYSMHLAISEDGEQFTALNHNSGVLFVKATENADGSLQAKSIKNPWIFKMSDRFGVLAIRTEGEGAEDEQSKGMAVLFTTADFLVYEEVGLLKLGKEYVEKVFCVQQKDGYHILWQEKNGDCHKGILQSIEGLQLYSSENCVWEEEKQLFEDGLEWGKNLTIEGVVPHNIIEIEPQIAKRLYKKLLPPVNTGIEFPKQIEAETVEQLQSIYAKAHYSDGSFAYKQIDWDLSGVNFQRKGSVAITGRVHREHYSFPIAFNRADPCIGKWNGKYYFIATNDADGNHTLYIREADSIPELVQAEEHLLLDSNTYPGIGGLLWAPEFHEVNGRLYIFHAATPGEFFYEESHVMELREGGNPICKEDWSAPKRVVRKDGSNICEEGKEITLDMTCFAWEGDYYVIWSQRQFLPKDLGAWLYIAKLNPQKPWELLTDPVVLSKPEYGWANNHTFVDEGPFALPVDGKLHVTFSSAAIDTSYVVGLLTIEAGKDLLNPRNWQKRNYPILTSRSVEGEFGTGHNAYVMDESGTIWNTYHARPGVDGVRSSGIRRVHFDIDNDPVLDLVEELDVKEELAAVETTLIIK